MGRCACLAWLFRKHDYGRVHNHSVTVDQSANLPQAAPDFSKKYTFEGPVESPQPVIRSDTGKSGTYVFRKDSVQLVSAGVSVGKSQEAPVVASEDKIAVIRKRLASM